ncbi:hypothetical protein [Proteus hauseri]|uniref:hypothetical protein n=1 Tax=Proteus hauseri TaxID=183417 RepID=UPI0032DBE8AB
MPPASPAASWLNALTFCFSLSVSSLIALLGKRFEAITLAANSPPPAPNPPATAD